MPIDSATLEAAGMRWKQHMMRGDFSSAWRESDFIASTGYHDPHRFWSGESWAGKRVMLRCLHGLGDAIQFIRYAPMLGQTCRSLIVQSHPDLVRLLACVPGVDSAVTWGQRENEWDVQMEVTELPRIFRTEAANIPSPTPYIHLSDHMIRWAEQFIGESSAVKVGLVWRASAFDASRSISGSEMTELLEVPSCDFYILQKDGDASLAGHDVQRYTRDVAETAALMSRLDLVISVDTMAAHLAGALGRKTWLLLPASADWRWMKDRSDSPWYPTMKIFRQVETGKWQAPVREVSDALREMSAGRARTATREARLPTGRRLLGG